MITTYHRPQTLDEALTFLNQPNTLQLELSPIVAIPMGFGEKTNERT